MTTALEFIRYMTEKAEKRGHPVIRFSTEFLRILLDELDAADEADHQTEEYRKHGAK